MDCKPRSRGCSFVLSFPSDDYPATDVSSSSRYHRSSSSVCNSASRTVEEENRSTTLRSSAKLVRKSSWKSKPAIPVRMNMSSIIRICTKDGTNFNSGNLAGLMNANEQRRLKTICTVYGRSRERMEELQQKSSTRPSTRRPACTSTDAKAKFLTDDDDDESRSQHDTNNDESRSASFKKSSSLGYCGIKTFPRHKSISVPFSELKEFLERQLKLYSAIDNSAATEKSESVEPRSESADSATIKCASEDAKLCLLTRQNDRCHLSEEERRKLRTDRHHRHHRQHHQRHRDTVMDSAGGSSMNSYQPASYDRVDYDTRKNGSADSRNHRRRKLDLKNILDMANKLRDLGFDQEANSIKKKIDDSGAVRERKPSRGRSGKDRRRLLDSLKLGEETDDPWISKLIGFLDGN